MKMDLWYEHFVFDFLTKFLEHAQPQVGFNLTQTRTYKRDLKQASLLKVLECPCDDKDKIVANVSSSFEKITSGKLNLHLRALD